MPESPDQHLIDELYSELKGEDSSANGHRRADEQAQNPLSDAEIIELCRRAKNAAKFVSLFDEGDLSAYGNDHSRADQALMDMFAFYTKNPDQLERLFARSALARRAKWDRADYRRRTIDRALKTVTEQYTPGRRGASYEHPTPRTDANGHKERGLAGRVRLGERIRGGAEPPDTLTHRTYRGKVHAINSEPGEGKTLYALYECLEVMRQGYPVAFFDRENGPSLIAERLEDIRATPEELDENFHYYFSPEITLDEDAIADLIATIEEIAPALAVFDSLPDFLALSGLNENDAGDVTRWMVNVAQALRDRGIAVILLDHLTKSVEGRGRYARGSGAKLAKVDVSWSLTQTVPFDRERVGEIQLTLRKDREAYLPTRQTFAVGGTEGRLMFEPADGVIEESGADGLTANARFALHILEGYYRETGATFTEWLRATMLAKTTFRRAVKALLEGDHCEQRARRYYPKPVVLKGPF